MPIKTLLLKLGFFFTLKYQSSAIILSVGILMSITIPDPQRGRLKRDAWHRETIKIVGTDIARLDNTAPDETAVLEDR